MKVNDRVFVGLVSMLLYFSVSVHAQGAWEVDKQKDGIKIYTRNEKNSNFRSFKAIMLVEASPVDILKVLREADRYTDWYGFTKASKLLDQHHNVQYNYVETIFPWPYKNRDMVYKMSIDTAGTKSTRIHLVGLPNYIPEKKGVVRMQKAEGYLLLTPLGKHTEITYMFHSEPGDIPVWLANSAIAELPFKTLSGLRANLRK